MYRFIKMDKKTLNEEVLEKKNKKFIKKEKPVIEKTEESVDIAEFLTEEE